MIYLVGAGPGDPGLLTLRAYELIRRADVIIHDALVSDEVLALARDGARMIHVGKRSRSGSPYQTFPSARTVTTRDSAAPSQDEINALLVKVAREDGNPCSTTIRTIVRLKGGDPFVFGRGGEEALHLYENGIDFEIVPGITSAIAAPAYAGIPVTHRGLAEAVTFITGHRDPRLDEHRLACSASLPGPDYSALVKLRGTVVFLMGAGKLDEIARDMMRHGKSPQTPAAVIQWGTRSNQQSIVSTLELIADATRNAGVSSPAVFVIGDVTTLGNRLDWFGRRSLFGKKIVVTKSREEHAVTGRDYGSTGSSSDAGLPVQPGLVAALRERGACVIEAPGIELRRLPPDLIDAALKEIATYSDLVLTSPFAARILGERMAALRLDARSLSGVRVSVMGPATAAALLKAVRIRADVMPAASMAEGLCDEWGATGEPGDRAATAGRRFLWPCAKETRGVIASRLGAALHAVPVYEAVPQDLSHLREAIAENEAGSGKREAGRSRPPGPAPRVPPPVSRPMIDFVVFSSAASVTNFMKALGDDPGLDRLRGVTMISIGPVTSAALKKFGFDAVTAETPSVDGLVKIIEASISS